MTSSSAPFTFAVAFSTNPFGGNPAAIVLLDPLTTSLETQHGLSLNFNQPMCVFVKPVEALEPGQTVIHTDIRFMPVSGNPVGICGHGSLAAAKALLSLPHIEGKGIQEIRFRALDDRVIPVCVRDGGFLELELPAVETTPLSDDEAKRVREVMTRAFGREIKINYMGKGLKPLTHALLVEIDESENLQDCVVEAMLMGQTGFEQNAVTSNVSASKGVEEAFISRMFSPDVPGGEDAVCGSAHCLLTPYWYKKNSIHLDSPVIARQVSKRGGVLKVNLNTATSTIRLSGPAAVISTGQCYF